LFIYLILPRESPRYPFRQSGNAILILRYNKAVEPEICYAFQEIKHVNLVFVNPQSRGEQQEILLPLDGFIDTTPAGTVRVTAPHLFKATIRQHIPIRCYSAYRGNVNGIFPRNSKLFVLPSENNGIEDKVFGQKGGHPGKAAGTDVIENMPLAFGGYDGMPRLSAAVEPDNQIGFM
jgi:hypothetical protein